MTKIKTILNCLGIKQVAARARDAFTFERVRTFFLVGCLTVSAATAGSSFGATLLLREPQRHLRVNPLVISSVKPAQIREANLQRAVESVRADIKAGASQELNTQVALNSAAIEEIIKQNQVSIDDRAQIHNTMVAMAGTEVNHYNQLNDRLNVDDARVMTIGWILGILFTLSQAIVVFFHLDRRRMNHRQLSYSEPVPYYPGFPAPVMPSVPPGAPAGASSVTMSGIVSPPLVKPTRRKKTTTNL